MMMLAHITSGDVAFLVVAYLFGALSGVVGCSIVLRRSKTKQRSPIS